MANKRAVESEPPEIATPMVAFSGKNSRNLATASGIFETNGMVMNKPTQPSPAAYSLLFQAQRSGVESHSKSSNLLPFYPCA